MKKQTLWYIIFAVHAVATVVVIVLACIFGIPCKHEDAAWVVTDATCATAGEEKLVCPDCELVLESERLAPLGHKYGLPITVKIPTCTERGSEQQICDRCGDVKSNSIKANGHTKEPAVIEKYVDPTCTEVGGYDTVEYCSVCEEAVTRKRTVIDALGHTEAAPVVEKYLNSTCTVNGSYDIVVYCSRPTCTAELDRQGKVIPAPGHFISSVFDGQTVTYSCSACDLVSTGSQGLEYTLGSHDTYTVTSIGNCTDEYVFIPSYFDGKKVVAIADGAFADSAIRYIGIAPTVEIIGDRAFANCKALDDVILPAGVTAIGDSVFSGCSSLKSILLPAGVTEIGDSAFYGCITLESVTLPEGVKSIGNSAFQFTALSSLVIPDSVTEIGDSAFYGCALLSEITLGKSVAAIGDFVFFGCKSLAGIYLPGSIKSIGDQAFSYCESLKSILLPAGVTEIGNYAFSDCPALETVVISENLTALGASVFYRCTSLLSIEFGGTADQWADLAANLGYSYSDYTVVFAK